MLTAYIRHKKVTVWLALQTQCWVKLASYTMKHCTIPRMLIQRLRLIRAEKQEVIT